MKFRVELIVEVPSDDRDPSVRIPISKEFSEESKAIDLVCNLMGCLAPGINNYRNYIRIMQVE